MGNLDYVVSISPASAVGGVSVPPVATFECPWCTFRTARVLHNPEYLSDPVHCAGCGRTFYGAVNMAADPAHELGPVTVSSYCVTDRWGSTYDYEASAACSCGAIVTGRCCSPGSARQWLATEHYHHRTADLAAFTAFGLVTVDVALEQASR